MVRSLYFTQPQTIPDQMSYHLNYSPSRDRKQP